MYRVRYILKEALGDVNGDGSTNSGDVTILQYHLENFGGVSLTEEQQARADINGDGNVNRDDWTVLNQIVFFSGSKYESMRSIGNLYGAEDLSTFKINGNLELDAGTSVDKISIDGTLSGNSDDAVPTEKAVKSYVDNVISSNTYTAGTGIGISGTTD